MAMTLNCLHFNNISSFGKTRKSHGSKCGRQWQYAASNFVFSHKFMHRQNKSRCSVTAENPIVWVPYVRRFLPWSELNQIHRMLATSRLVMLLFFRTNFFAQTTRSPTLLIDGHRKQQAPFTEVTQVFNLETTPNLTVCSLKASFKHLEVSLPCLPSLQQILCRHAAFQVCHFLGTPESQTERHPLVLNKT